MNISHYANQSVLEIPLPKLNPSLTFSTPIYPFSALLPKLNR